MTMLNEARVRSLLAELGERLVGRGIEAEVYVVGGVAMMLAYDRTRVTRDIGAISVPQEEIDAEVAAMAVDHGDLDTDWLNARVLPLLPRSIDADRIEVLGAPGITVNVASARHLLAMKARSGGSDRDLDDIWVLFQILGLTDIEQVWQICSDVWGGDVIREDVQMIVADDLARRLGPGSGCAPRASGRGVEPRHPSDSPTTNRRRGRH